MNFLKKSDKSPVQKEKEELITQLRHTQQMLKQAEMMFHMTIDDDLMEARIYHIKSLAKQQDYLITALRQLNSREEDKVLTNI